MRNDNLPPRRPTRIRATCPGCGEIELTAPEIDLRVATGDSGSFYAFTCPDCTQVIRKPADERIVRLLMSGGVHAECWDPPAELLEPHAGPPFTYDDILDLHLLLESPDCWSRLEACCR